MVSVAPTSSTFPKWIKNRNSGRALQHRRFSLLMGSSPIDERVDSKNYLNIPPDSRDRFIYRITSVDRLLEFFQTGKNVLVAPYKWDDPFENFVLRSRVKLGTGELARFEFHDQFYGQCWTLQKSSDAMWRIYSPRKDAVRIRSTIRRVAESLSHARAEWAEVEVFIGEVGYIRQEQIVSHVDAIFQERTVPPSRMFARTLLVKRPAFRHEREVRLLFFQQDGPREKSAYYTYATDPHNLVCQIMIDPRMSIEAAKALRARIIAETGYRGAIKRSLLYRSPPEMVFRFP